MLVSKAAKSDQTEDILPKQRTLAEITDLVHTAHLIHTGVINLNTPNESLEMGNKMAVLCGDFLLARSCVLSATLQNLKVDYSISILHLELYKQIQTLFQIYILEQVVELIAQAISDFSTAEFIDIVANETDTALDRWSHQSKLRY